MVDINEPFVSLFLCSLLVVYIFWGDLKCPYWKCLRKYIFNNSCQYKRTRMTHYVNSKNKRKEVKRSQRAMTVARTLYGKMQIRHLIFVGKNTFLHLTVCYLYIDNVLFSSIQSISVQRRVRWRKTISDPTNLSYCLPS